MTKLEVLRWGLNHIAKNHGFHASTDEDEIMCIFGGTNVPTFADVCFLCEDQGISRGAIVPSWAGVDVNAYFDGWLEKEGTKEYTSDYQFWRREDVPLGS